MDFHHRKTLAVTLLQDLFTKKSKKTPQCLGAPHTSKTQKPWGISPADSGAPPGQREVQSLFQSGQGPV